jgi:hypothetical protein
MTQLRGSRLTAIVRSAAVAALLVSAAGCAGSAASAGAGSGRGAGGADMFAGTWEGTFAASEFSGTLRMSLTWTDGSYSGTVTAGAMGEEFTSDIENFKQEEKGFTFYTYMADGDLYFTGALDGDTITGSFQVFVQGEQQDEATFRFEKK